MYFSEPCRNYISHLVIGSPQSEGEFALSRPTRGQWHQRVSVRRAVLILGESLHVCIRLLLRV